MGRWRKLEARRSPETAATERSVAATGKPTTAERRDTAARATPEGRGPAAEGPREMPTDPQVPMRAERRRKPGRVPHAAGQERGGAQEGVDEGRKRGRVGAHAHGVAQARVALPVAYAARSAPGVGDFFTATKEVHNIITLCGLGPQGRSRTSISISNFKSK